MPAANPTGWRYWTYDGRRLIGPGDTSTAWDTGHYTAQCPHGCDDIPAPACECGAYYFPTLAELLPEVNGLMVWRRKQGAPPAQSVIGSIHVHGRCLPDPREYHGLRSTGATITHLYADGLATAEDVAALQERYGAPVTHLEQTARAFLLTVRQYTQGWN
jgi:hypothetical protein